MPANEVKLKKENIIESGNEGLECFGSVQLGLVKRGQPKPFFETVSIVHQLSFPAVLGLSLEGPPPPGWCLDLKITPLAPFVPPFEFGPIPLLSPLVTLPLKSGIPPVMPAVVSLAPSPPLTEVLPPPSPPPMLVTQVGALSPPGAITHYSRPGAVYGLTVSGTLNTAALQEGVYSYVFYIHAGKSYDGPLTVPIPYGISPASRVARVGIAFTVVGPT